MPAPHHAQPASGSPAARLAAGAGYAGEWALFRDYCAATGQPALPINTTTLLRFLTQIPAAAATRARRVRAIAAAHRHAGYLPTQGGEDRLVGPVPAMARVLGSADPQQLLAACPARGRPDGLVGRRDAFLIVLLAVLGHTVTQARQLAPADIQPPADGYGTGVAIRVRGHTAPTTTEPGTCPACAVYRWLDILGTADGLGRGSAHMQLAAASAPTPADPHTHTLPDPPRWRRSAQLLPAIDQHGWLNDNRPLSTRAITTRLALAASRNFEPAATATATGPMTAPTASPHPPSTGKLVHSLDQVLTRLDQVADAADTLNARIQSLLSNTIDHVN